MKARTLGDRLVMLLKAMDLPQYKFAEKYSVSKSSITRYRNNERYPEGELLAALAKENVNIHWLFTGEGEMFVQKDFERLLSGKNRKKLDLIAAEKGLTYLTDTLYNRTVIMPVVAEISAGSPMPVPDDYEFLQNVEIPKAFLKNDPDKYLVFRVNGRSMEPLIHNADVVVIRSTPMWDDGDNKVCAVRTDEGITLKKVIIDHKMERIILQPFNMDFSVLIIDSDQTSEVSLIGVMSLQLRVF
jgi:SOS-response transcriptional repressor LexA